jgi:hypothetical protein
MIWLSGLAVASVLPNVGVALDLPGRVQLALGLGLGGVVVGGGLDVGDPAGVVGGGPAGVDTGGWDVGGPAGGELPVGTGIDEPTATGVPLPAPGADCGTADAPPVTLPP